MNEALFQFIWQNNLYNLTDLYATDGEPIVVLFCGNPNKNAGPDFLEARIKIGNTILVGNLELHIKASDWLKHGHQNDNAYKNLILHVVYENDLTENIDRTPTLELRNHIPDYVISRFRILMSATQKLPCAGMHNTIKFITKENWLSSLLAERWEQKLVDWNVMLKNTAEDWRNLLYWRMAANFGFKVNATPFLMLAQSLPLNITAKHRDSLSQIEALFFGQAGMLNDTYEDEYPNELQKEYSYLKKKYKLTPIPAHLWKFLRMRPANFPTIRIAQFAALVQKSVHLFSRILEAHTINEIEPLLEVVASDYWNNHFRFDEMHDSPSQRTLGRTSLENIIINTIAPIQFLYASRQDNYQLSEQALHLLETAPPESNAVIKIWEANKWHPTSAAQSQALLQLYNNYCASKRCLECTIGLNIIRTST